VCCCAFDTNTRCNVSEFCSFHLLHARASISTRLVFQDPNHQPCLLESIPKLKLLKPYLRSTVTDLATIALESDMLEKIDYELRFQFEEHQKNDAVQINICDQGLNRYSS